MYKVLRNVLSPVQRPPFRIGCRVIAGRRYPVHARIRQFHRTGIINGNPRDTENPSEQPSSVHSQEVNTHANGIFDAEVSAAEKDQPKHYGSAARRSLRNRKTKENSTISIPTWFVDKNVILKEERHFDKVFDSDGVTIKLQGHRRSSGSSNSDGDADEEFDGKYEVNKSVFDEIKATISAGFNLTSTLSSDRLILQCPKDGGSFFLETILGSVAQDLEADVIEIDPQDIAELSLSLFPDSVSDQIATLGYEALYYDNEEPDDADDGMEGVDERDNEDDQSEEPASAIPSSSPKYVRAVSIPIAISSRGSGTIPEIMQSLRALFPPNSNIASTSNEGPGKGAFAVFTPNIGSPRPEPIAQTLDRIFQSVCALKRTLQPALESSAYLQLTMEQSETGPDEEASSKEDTPLILHIRDYKEIEATPHGYKILSALKEMVNRRRQAGQRAMIVGTTSSADLVPAISKPGFKSLQSEYERGPTSNPGRTIVVTPEGTDADVVFSTDIKQRTKEINLRHLRGLLRRRIRGNQKNWDFPFLKQLDDANFDSAIVFSSGLNESVWSQDRIHRFAVLVQGIWAQNVENEDDPITLKHVEEALGLMDQSDDAKFKWATVETVKQDLVSLKVSEENPVVRLNENASQKMSRLKAIRKNCTPHEKKLLSGVIDADSIKTTFADVHVPPETIEALKTLTSLSLIRPEAFSYGVLSTDKIPGLLLYGPPGTGKTLLAKAVAKESGATVLEVSGSDVYDMYVGEGEKNVKAMFTLARKLSPCVVFIDEADAIFGSRSSQGIRASHRELINQFLREWDGMNDLSAFIMVATNRPFDLDDAVLRRLPRRLLVDLPVEKDREAILKIHLKDEILDPSVSLAELAAKTPLYSGSDLKNLCVAAALACVKEENKAAAVYKAAQSSSLTSTSKPPQPYQYPVRRILTRKHFDKAIEEISASISEDMASLSAIRKFDETFGDRKGRRKKVGGWGFGPLTEEKQEEDARVRKNVQ